MQDGKPQTLAQATSSTHDAAATAAAAAAAAAAAQPEISPVEQTAAHSRHAVTPLQRDKTPAIDHAQVATGSAEPSTSAASARSAAVHQRRACLVSGMAVFAKPECVAVRPPLV